MRAQHRARSEAPAAPAEGEKHAELVEGGIEERIASGRWEIKIEGLPAGATAGTLNYVDISKTHADNEMPLIINLAQGPDLPTVTPTPKPTITKKPTDGCAKQIKH